MTLSIYAGDDRCFVHCFAGCSSDDILKAVNLTWRDTYYQPFQKLSPKAWRDALRIREAESTRRSNLRIGELILRFIERGYTQEDHNRDMKVVAACATVLANKSGGHWERMFERTMERIAAADHCRERGMIV